MNWEKLTSPEFERAVQDCERVCLLPIGVVEKHGDHLPLGQDVLYIHRVCTLAAEEEPAMVFPWYYFGQILEAKHVPGTVALRGDLLVPLLENVCDEIGRNGFRKIILVNGHGGNNAFLPFFCQLMLDRQKNYMVFFSNDGPDTDAVRQIREAAVDGHAGESETSSMLHLYPDLVKMAAYRDYGRAMGRMQAFRDAGLQSGISWYADHPEHMRGDAVSFTPEKGEVFVQARMDRIVEHIRLVKSTDEPDSLYREFHTRAGNPGNR